MQRRRRLVGIVLVTSIATTSVTDFITVVVVAPPVALVNIKMVVLHIQRSGYRSRSRGLVQDQMGTLSCCSPVLMQLHRESVLEREKEKKVHWLNGGVLLKIRG